MFNLIANNFRRKKYDNLQVGDKLYSPISETNAEIIEIREIAGLKHYGVSLEKNSKVFKKTLAPDGLLLGGFEKTN
jgi:hypothetical protein